MSIHIQDSLRDLKCQFRSHGRRLGQFVLIYGEIISAKQGDRPEPDLPLQ